MAKSKQNKLDKYRLFYEMASIRKPPLPAVRSKRPGRKPKKPKLPENLLENLD